MVYNDLFHIFSEPQWFVACCVTCIVFPAAYMSAPLFGLFGVYAYEERMVQCTISYSHVGVTGLVFIFVGLFLPTTIVVGSYLRIAIYVRQQGQALEDDNIHKKHRMQRTARRFYILISAPVFTYLMGVVPLTMLLVFDPDAKRALAHLWAFFMVWTTYMLNPIVYSLMDFT